MVHGHRAPSMIITTFWTLVVVHVWPLYPICERDRMNAMSATSVIAEGVFMESVCRFFVFSKRRRTSLHQSITVLWVLFERDEHKWEGL